MAKSAAQRRAEQSDRKPEWFAPSKHHHTPGDDRCIDPAECLTCWANWKPFRGLYWRLEMMELFLVVWCFVIGAFWLGYRTGYRHGADDYRPPIYTPATTGDSNAKD